MHYIATSALPVSVEQAFAYHDRPGALKRLIPPWESIEVVESDQSIEVGSRVVLKTSLAGIPFRWIAQHTEYDPPELFIDDQESGPFRSWSHRHEFHASGDHCLMRDQVSYQLPGGALGRLVGGGMVQQKLESTFAYRHRLVRDDLTLAADHPTEPLSIAISGSSGLVGSQLSTMLTLLGHSVRPIVRAPEDDQVPIAVWHSDAEAGKLNEVDAVVHLAGRPIAADRWTAEVKQEILASRVDKTRALCQSLAELDHKPDVLVCASATGIYGDRGDEWLDEDSSLGDGFLAEVARQWERACQPAKDAGIRVVHVRLGLVLTPAGGALNKLLLPAKLGGGSLGSGRQWCSWIGLDDVLGAIYHAIMTDRIVGAVNLVSPEPCTNAEFARSLASAVHRPALIPAPAFGLRLVMGEMADALLLASQRVRPQRLLDSDYRFRFNKLDDALRFYLGKARLASE